eukprot:scaffold60147_cov35-Tisochrysis_lutea.AAC.2
MHTCPLVRRQIPVIYCLLAASQPLPILSTPPESQLKKALGRELGMVLSGAGVCARLWRWCKAAAVSVSQRRETSQSESQ